VYRAFVCPVLIHIVAHICDFISNSERRDGVVMTAVNGCNTISKCTRKHMDSIQGDRMQLHQDALAKSKGLLFFFDECLDYVQGKLGLTYSVFGLTSRLFFGIGNQIDLFGRCMATPSHGLLSA
jgi:hypothetical protein